MKNISFFLLVFAFLFNCKAQVIYPLGTQPEQITEDNYYIKDTNNIHDQIVGIWKWEDNNNSFEITLAEFEQYSYPDNTTQYRDRVFGKYKYIENGTIVSEVTEISGFPQFKLSLSYQNSSSFYVHILDIVSGKYKVGEFVLNGNGTASLNLEDPVGGTSGVRLPNDPPPNNLEFQLPTNITLTKIE